MPRLAALNRCSRSALLRPGSRSDQSGVALILTLILTVLLYVLVAELATTTKHSALSSDNEALLSRMDRAMRNAARECEQVLLDDMTQGSAGGGGSPTGGAPSGGGLPMPGGNGGAGQGGGQEEPNDSSHDTWFEPQAYTDGDLTTYTWVEDENRKFNLLNLVSSDEQFAKESYDRLVRLIDYFREGTAQDLGRSDAERIAGAIREWLEGKRRSEDRPRAPLKSNKEDTPITLPLVLEEILLLPEVPEDLFQDKVVDGVLIPGLDSILTIYTALRFEEAATTPGTGGSPGGSGVAPQASGSAGQPRPTQGGSSGGGNSATASARQTSLGGNSGAAGQPGTSGNRAGGSAAGGNAQQPQDEAIGQGVRINVNTASRAMLRSLLSDREMPAELIEALLRHRNEDEDPEAARKAAAAAGGAAPEPTSSATTSEEEQKPKKKIFATLDALDEVEAFKNWGDMQSREKFLSLVTTQSDVFTIHMASVFKRNEEKKVFVIKRARTVVVRNSDREGSLYPLLPMSERPYLRVMPIDFPEQAEEERRKRQDMEKFALEERSWNPFYLEFYRKEK